MVDNAHTRTCVCKLYMYMYVCTYICIYVRMFVCMYKQYQYPFILYYMLTLYIVSNEEMQLITTRYRHVTTLGLNCNFCWNTARKGDVVL